MIYDTWKYRVIGAQQTNEKLLLLLLVLFYFPSIVKIGYFLLLLQQLFGPSFLVFTST